MEKKQIQMDTPHILLEQTQQQTMEQEELFDEKEKQQIEQFSQTIDMTDSQMVLQYGSASQKKIASFSQSALETIRTKDLGQIGDLLSGLVNEVRGFELKEQEKGIRGFFKRSMNQVQWMKSQYDHAEASVEKISQLLESQQLKLMKDISMLDKMYQLNIEHFKELSMYIAAGERKLQQIRETDLVELQQKALQSQKSEHSQAANDLALLCERFEKKLHDLKLTRTIAIQLSPQIRMVQNNDLMMAEKIQSTMVNTIPLWKSQMVLALGMANAQQAISVQKQVDDATNELLRKNAQALKQSTIDTTKAAQRGIVDIDTLKYTNEMLLSTLDEVVKIQQEGWQYRQQAEQEMVQLEGQLRNRLLKI